MSSTGPTARDPLRTSDDVSEPVADGVPRPGPDLPDPPLAAGVPPAHPASCRPERSPDLRDEGLSDEELAVLRLVAEGLPIDSVAVRLGMSPRTVRRRMHRVCEHIGVTNTIRAVVWAAHRGLV